LDPGKAAINLRKHRVSFDVVLREFADPFALTAQVEIERGEQRRQTLGVVEGHLFLLVAPTVREEHENGEPLEIIRVISARTADRKERQCDEQETR
jgi:uncharacterized DUF497 family protein